MQTGPRFAQRLDLEWERLSRHRPSVRVASSWGLVDRRLDHLDELLVAAGFGVTGPRPARHRQLACNKVLADLVVRARTDDLAARIVLQRVLPGLRHRARTWCSGTNRAFDDVLGDIVGAAWGLIRTYDVGGRGGFVAANIVRDAWHNAFVAPLRRLGSGECPTAPSSMDTPDESTARTRGSSGELLMLLADARRCGVAAEHISLISELVSADGSTERVAKRHKVTGRAIRYRRTKATAALREFVLDVDGTTATATAA